MSLVTTGLIDYAKQEGFNLIVKAITEGKTAGMVDVILNLKGKAEVPFLTSNVELVKGHSCTFADTSTSTFTQVEVDVNEVSYMEKLCTPVALENKAMLYEVRNSDDIPYSEQFLNLKAQDISKKVDTLLWLGEKSGDAVNGFLKMADDNSLLIEITGSTSNVYDAIELALDTAVAADSTWEGKESVKIFMNYTKFRTYFKELIAKNLFHYDPEVLKSGAGINHPSAPNVIVVPTEGLAGHNFLYLADTEHLHMGTNLASELEGITIIYKPETREIFMRSDFYLGTGVSKEIFQKAI